MAFSWPEGWELVTKSGRAFWTNGDGTCCEIKSLGEGMEEVRTGPKRRLPAARYIIEVAPIGGVRYHEPAGGITPEEILLAHRRHIENLEASFSELKCLMLQAGRDAEGR